MAKDKSELKALLLARKKPVVLKDTYICSNCKEDVRTNSKRTNVIREDDTTVTWRFICGCGFAKIVTVSVK